MKAGASRVLTKNRDTALSIASTVRRHGRRTAMHDSWTQGRRAPSARSRDPAQRCAYVMVRRILSPQVAESESAHNPMVRRARPLSTARSQGSAALRRAVAVSRYHPSKRRPDSLIAVDPDPRPRGAVGTSMHAVKTKCTSDHKACVAHSS